MKNEETKMPEADIIASAVEVVPEPPVTAEVPDAVAINPTETRTSGAPVDTVPATTNRDRRSLAEELDAAIHNMFIELLDAGGGDAYWVAEMLADERPDLLDHFERLAIENRAAALFASDLAAESERFQTLFAQFNSKFFAGSLPEYHIGVKYAINGPDDEGYPSTGIIDAQKRLIWLRMTNEALMVATLLHEMAHAATNGEHEAEWNAEMKRLYQLGAPVLRSDFDD